MNGRTLAALLLFCAVAAAAQTAEERGKKVIDDAVAALGGQKFLTMEDRIESGRVYTFYREQVSSYSVAKVYTRHITVAPGKSGEELGVQERQAFGKNEDTAVLFRQDGGWEISWRGAKEIAKDRFERYRDTTLRNIFYILRQRLNEPGMIFELRGADVFENLPVQIVDVTDSQDRVETVYFHESTKLPVREIYSWRDPQTKERNDEETRFSRYRDTGAGVQWPHDITRKRNGEKVYEIFSESVLIDQDLTDNLFSVPGPGETTQKGPAKKK